MAGGARSMKPARQRVRQVNSGAAPRALNPKKENIPIKSREKGSKTPLDRNTFWAYNKSDRLEKVCPSGLFFDKVTVYLSSVHDRCIRCTSNFRRLPLLPNGGRLYQKAHRERLLPVSPGFGLRFVGRICGFCEARRAYYAHPPAKFWYSYRQGRTMPAGAFFLWITMRLTRRFSCTAVREGGYILAPGRFFVYP